MASSIPFDASFVWINSRLGAGGTVHAFGPLQEKFRSALWVIQVTPDTPLTSLVEQTSFYYRKIKVGSRASPANHILTSLSGTAEQRTLPALRILGDKHHRDRAREDVRGQRR